MSPVIDLSHHLSDVSKARLKSEIDDKFNHGFPKGTVNLAAGLPNAEFFPFRTIEAEVVTPPDLSQPSRKRSVPSRHFTVPYHADGRDGGTDIATVLQYGPPSGLPRLVDTVRTLTREYLHHGLAGRELDVILTNGATDGMSKCLELFTNTWSAGRNAAYSREGILTEAFMYSAVLTQAEPRGLNIEPVEIDLEGMKVDGRGGLRDVLENWDYRRGRRPHLMYTVSCGNNPTGILVRRKRRKEIYDACCEFDVVIVEDEPYWFLQYDNGENGLINENQMADESLGARNSSFIKSLEPSFMNMDTHGRVVRLDTFSKMFAPGCRLGWVTATPQVIERLERITECFAHQPSGFVQGIVTNMINSTCEKVESLERPSSRSNGKACMGWQINGWISWLRRTRDLYRDRMTRTCEVLDQGSTAYVTSTLVGESWSAVSKVDIYGFSWPGAGMFVWLQFHFETHPLCQALKQRTGSDLTAGQKLSQAMFIYIQRRPYLIMAASGTTFGANERIREEQGWRFCRLCFAAETDEMLDDGIKRFVEGVHAFWEVRDVKVIDELLDEEHQDMLRVCEA